MEVVVNEPKSTRYHRQNRLAAACSFVCTAGVLGILLWTGGSVTLRDVASSASTSRPALVAIYVLMLAVIQEAFSLPLVFYRSFILDRRYDLGSQPLRAWLRDHAKAFVLLTALLLIAVEGVYVLIAWDPRWWWLPAGLLAAAAAMVIVSVAPVVLLPIFYKLTPLARDGLADRLLSLSQSAGVRVLGVYEWGLGEKTRRANAALVGSGATRRILLSDTLLAEYTDDEIEVILAHELAHHVHRDIARGLALETVVLLAAGCAAAAALNALWQPLQLTGPADVAGLPLLLLTAGAVMLATSPAANAFSRLNERRADQFALKLTNRREAFVSAMRRLATQNLLEEHPSRAVVWLFHTHPPIGERIDAARTSAG